MPEVASPNGPEQLGTTAKPDAAATRSETEQVSPLSPQFVAHLRTLYQDLRIVPAEEYLDFLAKTFTRNRCERAERRTRFKSDLAKIYSEIAPPYSEQHLNRLSRRFDSWRQETKLRMKEHLARLPADDPLTCPISLFGPMHCGRLETAHTHLLAWLLDPTKEHGFGLRLLQALLGFFREMPGTLQIEKVQPEFPIEDGRIDVLVQGRTREAERQADGWLLVIEAKIDANEGELQLAKYDKWIRKFGRGRDVFRLFLTAEGRDPETSDEDWTPMSFLQLARIFRMSYKDLEGLPGHQFLRYYLTGVLKDICHWSLPVQDTESSSDPYGFAEYLKTVDDSMRKGPAK